MLKIFSKAIDVEASEFQCLHDHVMYDSWIVFNPDKKRFQRDITRDNKLIEKVLHFLTTKGLTRNRYFGGAVVLHSEKHCKKQYYHTDYDPDKLHNARYKPAGVIVALENDTKFMTPAKVYYLKKGDVLIFEGDIVHCGASYTKPNTRIHIYLDVIDVKREENKTWLVSNVSNTKKRKHNILF
tara:strand:- start:34 stop:582 length:549 start_codon:yes stop_codon:yes gene_type:complete